MIPDNKLSTHITQNPFNGFLGGIEFDMTYLTHYVDGGVNLGDTSLGLYYQIWRVRVVNNNIVINASNIPDIIVYHGINITEMNLAFDQNMNTVIAVVDNNVTKIRYYDLAINSSGYKEVIIPDIINPRVSLDDKRQLANSYNDVILAYLKGEDLYFRQQREDYSVERLLKINAGSKLIKIGMNRAYQLQFLLKKPTIQPIYTHNKITMKQQYQTSVGNISFQLSLI